jgi:hypothetical protein
LRGCRFLAKEEVMIRRFTIAAALAGLVGLGSGAVYAEDSERLHTSVPFDFKVGDAVLPAGRYDVSYDAVDSPGVLFVRGKDGRHSAVALVRSGATGKPSEDATLVFDRQGSNYALSKVFGPGEDTGLEVMGSQAAD